MKTQFDIELIIEKGIISNELDYERALMADRKLRLLAKENENFKNVRSKLRQIIEKYEKITWSNVEQINETKLIESEKNEQIASLESKFIENRKQLIKKKLKELDLTQEDLAIILSHRSKTHMSELINGLKPFTLKDLIIIHRIFKIDLHFLIPIFLSKVDQNKVHDAIIKINKPKIKLLNRDWVV